MMRQFELVDRVVGYEPLANEDLLNRAYVFATKMHGDQKRASGDPYFSHPVEVAGILTELRLDTATIATGLLHDTLEDTEATFVQLDDLFGGEVASLVDGVTKLSKLELASSGNGQAENFRKLLLATSNDIRILLVKLADRLHNMRTLHYIPSEEKRQRIAQETMDIFAPLAGRMGMQNFREEFEDLAFKQLNPAARELLVDRLSDIDETKSKIIDEIAYEFSNLLAEGGLSVQINGRRKSPFSIWRKMQHKSVSLEQLSDIFGYRVVVDSEDDCYRAMGILHRAYRFVPGRFKDYISMPKLNNYRSLHTTIVGPNKQRVEIQIRTQQMNKIAEQGVAAHWSYKEGGSTQLPKYDEIKPFNWLQEMVNQLKAGDSAEEFMENTKLELFTDQVFCFTPNGRLIALPRGATVLDFAYAVHTEIGNSCAGARINGQQVAVRTVLTNGDEIEVIRSDKLLPRSTWLENVVTGKARASIRQVLRERAEADYAELGTRLIKSLFASEGIDPKRELIERAVGLLSYDDLPSLYADVGRGKLSAADVMLTVLPPKERKLRASKGKKASDKQEKPDEAFAVPVSSVASDLAMKFEDGSFPIPGDPIVGIISPGEGLVIYPMQSSRLNEFEDQIERWVAMRWDVNDDNVGKHLFASRLVITVVNKTGTLGHVAQTIADFESNISNLSLWQRDDSFYDLTLDIQVRDVNHANKVISALRGSSVVSAVERFVSAS